MLRTNLTEENLTLTRAHIQAFLNSDVDAKTKKTKKKPDDLKRELKAKGHKDEEIDKVLGDWDSYL